nr:MAG TPA_asm: transmembrane protein [Caudoviricetes sp.]
MKIGFLSLLGLIFIVLKLTGTIDWSWWWVTSPLWGGIVIVIAIFIILRFLVVPLLDIYNRIFHKEEYKYMKKLNKRMNEKRKGNFQGKLRFLMEEQEKLRKGNDQL